MFDLQTAQKFAEFLRKLQVYHFNQFTSTGYWRKRCRSTCRNSYCQQFSHSKYLWRNGIGNTGAKVLAAALQFNTSIRVIDLYGNQIGNEGSKAIANMLRVNKSINSIDLTLKIVTFACNEINISLNGTCSLTNAATSNISTVPVIANAMCSD